MMTAPLSSRPSRTARRMAVLVFSVLRLTLALGTLLTVWAVAGESWTLSLIARRCAADARARDSDVCVSAVGRLATNQGPPVVALLALASATAASVRFSREVPDR